MITVNFSISLNSSILISISLFCSDEIKDFLSFISVSKSPFIRSNSLTINLSNVFLSFINLLRYFNSSFNFWISSLIFFSSIFLRDPKRILKIESHCKSDNLYFFINSFLGLSLVLIIFIIEFKFLKTI